MRRILAIAALALLTSGCGSLDLFSKTDGASSPAISPAAIQTELLRAELLYEAVQKGVVLYVERPTCTAPKTVVICATDAGRVQARKANRVANVALDKAEQVAAIPGVTSGAFNASISAVLTAVDGVRTVLSIYK